MKTFLTIVLIALMALTVFSLIRGVVAFLKTTKINLETGETESSREFQLKQNRAMLARIKFQALAVLVAAVILAISR